MSMLIVKACGVAGETEECQMVRDQAEAYGMTTKTISPKTKEELDGQLFSSEGYDYIYVSSHGNERMLCNHDNSIQITWLEFGLMLCDSGALNERTIIMLSCCRGGLNQVAFALFHSCDDVRYVVGPRVILDPYQMHICYGLLLYLLVQRDLDPVMACKKIEKATDIRFFFSDRLEVETGYAYVLSGQNSEKELNEFKKERGWFDDASEHHNNQLPVAPGQVVIN